jgi:hypothetical protein
MVSKQKRRLLSNQQSPLGINETQLGLVIAEWFLLLCQNWASRGEFRIEFFVTLPLFWQVVFLEDGFDGALWNTRFAVDALLRIDVEHRLTLVEAFHGAHHDAVSVLAVETRFGDDVSHFSPFLWGSLFPRVAATHVNLQQ